MKSNIKLLKITFWWGVIADLFEAVRMIIPDLFLNMTGADLVKNNELSFGLLYGMPVMVGWTIILYWASRKPFDRKGVLLCLIPVVALYIIIQIVWICNGILSFNDTLPTFVLQTVLITLCLLSYHKNNMSKARNTV